MENYMIRRMPDELGQWFKIEAVKQRKTLNQLVIEILEAYKKESEGKK